MDQTKGMTKAVNEEKMITLETVDGERVDFYVLEETRISGMNYLLVTDAPEIGRASCRERVSWDV